MLLVWEKIFGKFLSRIFGIAPIAPTATTTMLKVYLLQSFCMCNISSMHLTCFSLTAFPRFVSSGTVTFVCSLTRVGSWEHQRIVDHSSPGLPIARDSCCCRQIETRPVQNVGNPVLSRSALFSSTFYCAL